MPGAFKVLTSKLLNSVAVVIKTFRGRFQRPPPLPFHDKPVSDGEHETPRLKDMDADSPEPAPR